MRNRIVIGVLFCMMCVCAHAETILLRTGARVSGTIIFQNEEVVVIRDASGARFQYPRNDVEAVLSDAEAAESEAKNEAEVPEDLEMPNKKASILIELAGGAGLIPNEKTGGAASVDLLIGSHHIKDKHLFVGGGVGYHALFLGGDSYHFLPIQAALRMPMTEAKHAPVFGVGIGYGIALSTNYAGGLYAGLDLGYRCQLNPRSAIGVVGYTQFQQARVSVAEVIEGETFTHQVGRYLVSAGIKLAFYF